MNDVVTIVVAAIFSSTPQRENEFIRWHYKKEMKGEEEGKNQKTQTLMQTTIELHFKPQYYTSMQI